MRITNEDILEYIALHEQIEGEVLSFAEAEEIVYRVMDLALLLAKELPQEHER